MNETREIKISRRNNKGVALATCIILLIFASISVLSVTTFIVQRFSQIGTRRAATRALYLAQAGIHSALYTFRYQKYVMLGDGYFTTGQTDVDANNSFVVNGTDADLLMVQTSTPPGTFVDSNKSLKNFVLQNAVNSRSIIIDRMTVTWSGGQNLVKVILNGSTVWESSSASPFTIDLSPNKTIATKYTNNQLIFNNSISSGTISVQFVMLDGSTRTVVLWPFTDNFNFTVKASGKTTGSVLYRTIAADYNSMTNKVFNYYEIANQITP